jgi:hypothetical protein
LSHPAGALLGGERHQVLPCQAARAGRQHPLIKMQRDKRCIGGRGRLAQAAQLAKPIENILPDLITQFIEWAAVTFI